VTENADQTLSSKGRGLAIAVLVAVLVGTMVWAGTISADSTTNNFAHQNDFVPAPDAYVGERVEASGIVVSTEPVVIRVTASTGQTTELTVKNADPSVTKGQELGAFGTLVEPWTVDAQRTVVRDKWETQYMYLVSFLGGLWVFSRLVRHWRIDLSRLEAVPRGEEDA
jgi:hypothetical protein